MANATINAVLLVSPPQLTLSASGSLCDLSVNYVTGYASNTSDSSTFAPLTIPTATAASVANGGTPLPSTTTLDSLYALALQAIQTATGLVFTQNGGSAVLFDTFPVLA